MSLMKAVFVVFVIVIVLAPIRAVPSDNCSQVICPEFDPAICKNGYHIPPGKCCRKCKGVKCKEVHRDDFGICITNCDLDSEEQQCSPGKVCCKNECGGGVCE